LDVTVSIGSPAALAQSGQLKAPVRSAPEERAGRFTGRRRSEALIIKMDRGQ